MKRITGIILIILAALCSMPAWGAESGGDIRLFAKGEEVILPQAAYFENETLMVPLRPVSDAFGAACEWDEENERISVTLESVTVHFKIGSDEMIKYGEPVPMGAPVCYSGDYAMAPADALANAFGYPIEWDERNRAAFLGEVVDLIVNPMDGTVVTDDYRYNNFIGRYGIANIFSNGDTYFGMEIMGVNDDGDYAKGIANLAVDVPEADVYNIVVPTAQEFYAPNDRRADQTAGITALYNDLLGRNIPNLYTVNAVQTLSDHAAEKIYFNTDHHWTQKGAYYAYAEYSRVNPNIAELDPLDSYYTVNKYGFVGSMYSFSGSSYMSRSAEMLQLFYPKPDYKGAIYRDPYMNSYMSSVRAVNSGYDSYKCFIGGDYPLEVYKTDVNNGRKVCIIKDSYGNPFAVWALNNYEEVYVVDYRMFNGGSYGSYGSGIYTFKLKDFYDRVKFDDLIIIGYPTTVNSSDLPGKICQMVTWD